jgi:hypothetical protein
LVVGPGETDPAGGVGAEEPPQATVADQVAQQLAPYLGPFNARIAVRTFAQKAVKLAPEAVTIRHLPALLEALRPMLNTLVGRDSTESLLEKIRREVR